MWGPEGEEWAEGAGAGQEAPSLLMAAEGQGCTAGAEDPNFTWTGLSAIVPTASPKPSCCYKEISFVN